MQPSFQQRRFTHENPFLIVITRCLRGKNFLAILCVCVCFHQQPISDCRFHYHPPTFYATEWPRNKQQMSKLILLYSNKTQINIGLFKLNTQHIISSQKQQILLDFHQIFKVEFSLRPPIFFSFLNLIFFLQHFPKIHWYPLLRGLFRIINSSHIAIFILTAFTLRQNVKTFFKVKPIHWQRIWWPPVLFHSCFVIGF